MRRGLGARDEERRAVLRRALSVGVATGLYGISFGALATTGGLTLAQTCVLSLAMFSGGSQFAVVGVVSVGGGAAAAIAGAGLLGVRNGIYALSLSSLLEPRGLAVAPTAHLTIDESTAVATSTAAVHPQRPDLARLGFWATGAAIYVGWNVCTLLGATAGAQIADPGRFGLDAAAAAAFLALVSPRLHARGTQVAAAVAAVAALALVPAVPAGVPVLVAALVATLAGLRVPTGPGTDDE